MDFYGSGIAVALARCIVLYNPVYLDVSKDRLYPPVTREFYV